MIRSISVTLITIAMLVGPRAAHCQEAPTPEQAWKLLKDGNARFASDKFATKNVGAPRRAALAKGQKPFAVVLACADSRVAPEIIFDQGLGELFVVRVAGNLTDPFLLGSIEYGVEYLHVPLIVVLGHEKCGAVDAALSKKEFPGNLGKLIKEIHTGADLPKDRAEALKTAINNNAVYQSRQLTMRSEPLRDAVAQKKVKIVSAVYGLASGKVEWVESK
jgi:carbonic anhydrase